jgi:hypothetical protein
MTNPSDEINENDFAEKHPWQVDPNRKIVHRVVKKRDNNNQTKVGEKGDDKVRRTSTTTKDKRIETRALDYLERYLGHDRSLFSFYQDPNPEGIPTLVANKDNEEVRSISVSTKRCESVQPFDRCMAR